MRGPLNDSVIGKKIINKESVFPVAVSQEELDSDTASFCLRSSTEKISGFSAAMSS
jgi:hypothetical protein